MMKTFAALSLIVVAAGTAYAEVNLPPLHKKCIESVQAQPNAFKAGIYTTIKPTGKFGTYDDGDIWVEYDRMLWQENRLGKMKLKSKFSAVSAMCNSKGKAY